RGIPLREFSPEGKTLEQINTLAKLFQKMNSGRYTDNIRLSDKHYIDNLSQRLDRLFSSEIVRKIAGLSTEYYFTSENRCQDRKDAQKSSWETVKVWKVDVQGGAYEPFPVVLLSHSTDHFFYAPNPGGQASIDFFFDSPRQCKLR